MDAAPIEKGYGLLTLTNYILPKNFFKHKKEEDDLPLYFWT